MNRIVSIILTTFLVLTTLLGSLTAFADTEIDQTAPVINSFEFVDCDNLNSVTDYLNVKVKITEEGSGLSRLMLDFGNTSFSYDAQDYEDDELCANDPLLFTGEHNLRFMIGNALAVGTHELTEIRGFDRNGNEFSMDQKAIKKAFKYIPSVKVTYAEQRKEPEFELKSFRVLNGKNLDTGDKLQVEFDFDGNIMLNGMHLLLMEEGANESAGQATLVMGEGNELSAGKHTVEFDLDDIFHKGKYYVCYMDFGYGFSYHFEPNEDLEVHLVTGKEKNQDPMIYDFQVRNSSITAPEVLKIDLDLEDYGNSLNSIKVTYDSKNGKRDSFEGTLKKVNGKYVGEIPIGPFTVEGELKLQFIQVSDYLEDKGRYEAHTVIWRHENEELLKKADITVSSGYNITYFGSLGNKSVVQILKKMNAGETAVLDCRNYKNVKKEIFEAIAGRDVTVAFVDENVQWVFNGKSIKKSRCKKINLSSSIKVVSGSSAGFPDDKKVAKLVFRENGELPGEVEMRINYEYLAAKYKFSKENLKLTYLSPTNPILEDSDVDMAEDKYYEYEVDHNSTFVLSKGTAKLGATTVSLDTNNMNGVKIKWKKKAGNGYYIYRSSNKEGTYKKIATIKNADTVSYVDTNTTRGKNYYYKVKPYSKKSSYNKTGKMSQPCKAYTKLKAPRIYSVKLKQKGTVAYLEWTYNSEAKGYEVYRATKADGTYKKIITTSKPYYTDKKVKKGTTYYYKIKSIYKKDSKMNSAYSKVKGAV